MKVVTDAGETIELGAVETAPTIGIIDYSRRVTDDFGVTTVVERGFARRMSVKLLLAADTADVLQRRLADLRATPALWVADDRFDSLTVRGFYKDFSLDHAIPTLSYCTLTVEGLAATGAFADPGGDPAPEGQPSTLQLLAPVAITDAGLKASSVAEADAPEWSASAAYPSGVRVMKTATHRVYESVAAVNAGDDPAAASGRWLDVGPTNRWAMFDQALGSITSADKSIAVRVDAGAAGAVALLDVIAATVRVQATGYDRTVPAGTGAITFLDLPAGAGQVTVTIAGPGTVSVGTLLIGRLVALGITEASPTAGITDYSRKVVDDFGAISIVQRAWAKRMTANALIRTDAIDLVAGRIAAVRALPALWIGQAGLDSLTVYGFFKDFSIEVGETVSKLSLSIEGLSAAARIEPLKTSIDWPDIGDPDGTKPEDKATYGAPGNAPVGNSTGQGIVDRLDINTNNTLGEILRGDALAAFIDARTFIDGVAIGTLIKRLQTQFSDGSTAYAQDLALLIAKTADGKGVIIRADSTYVSEGKLLVDAISTLEADRDGVKSSITDLKEILYDESGVTLRSVNVLNSNGVQTGTINAITGEVGYLDVFADVYRVWNRNGGKPVQVFGFGDDGQLTAPSLRVGKFDAGSITIDGLAAGLSKAIRFTQADTQIGTAETTILETPAFELGKNGVVGSCLAFISFTQDSAVSNDTGARIRIYVDTGAGYQVIRDRISGLNTASGQTFWSFNVSIPVSISAVGQVRVKVTAMGAKVGGGGYTTGAYARDIALDTLQVGR